MGDQRDGLCQWAAVGYPGAMRTGQTLCGTLFAGTVFLGCLHGSAMPRAPRPDDTQRRQAIESVQGLFRGFIGRFGATDCRTLTGYDLSDAHERETLIDWYRRLGTEHGCNQQIKYVIAHCQGRFLEHTQG